MFKRILILCVGNICRSPMGEAMFTARLANSAKEVSVRSAGIAALVNFPADSLAQELIRERGLDISHHRARQVTPEMLLESDLILTMEIGHQKQIEYMLPSIRGRIHRIGHWSSFDVPDPYQRDKTAFVQALLLIEQGIDEWQRKLWN